MTATERYAWEPAPGEYPSSGICCECGGVILPGEAFGWRYTKRHGFFKEAFVAEDPVCADCMVIYGPPDGQGGAAEGESDRAANSGVTP